MARKKNLERAIILGLILSTGVYGSAWAATVKPIQNSNYNNDDNPFSESVIVNANTDGEKDSIGNIVLRDENNYNVIISTNNGNIEFEENSGSGILLADGIKTGTTVTINASGEISINAGYGIQGNAKDREYGNVSKISLTAKNNKITTSNIGIYSTGGVDILLNAESNEIISKGEYGIQATQSSDGKLNLIATNGNNTVKAENGTAIRANGKKVITLDASGNNIVIGRIYGIENTETNQFIKTHNKIYTDLDAVNNIIYGTDTAIKSDGLGITYIKADQNNNIGFLTNDKGEITDIAQTGINVTEGTVKVTAAGNNIIYGSNVGVSVSGENSKSELNAINNIITVTGDILNGYGKSYAINAIGQSSVDLTAGETNLLRGAVYASGSTGTDKTDVTLGGTSNMVLSNAHIANAGGLKDKNVISALYAEKGAHIELDGDYNLLGTYADSESPDLERVVWAYDTADINITGLTAISTDSYHLAIDGNSKDIAVAAGTATGLEELGKDAIENYNGERAAVNINYESDSFITGDILSAYAGKVNIKANDSVTRAASDSKMYIRGNLLAGNNGILNVNLGNGGQLTGRADDYGDAGVAGTTHGAGEETENSFFNPAFSSSILTGGKVNLTMGEGSVWNVTGQSWITSLTTTGNAEDTLISLEKAKEDLNSNASALTIGSLTGNTRFYMNLDGDRSASDMLYIKNAQGIDGGTAHYNIYLQDDVISAEINTDGTKAFNGLRFATVGTGSNVDFTVKSQGTGSAFDVEYEVDTDSYVNNSENSDYNSTIGGDANVEKPGDDSVNDFFGLSNSGTQEDTTETVANNIMPMAENEEVVENVAANNNTGLDEVTNFKIVKRLGEELNDTGKTILNMSRANYSNAIYMDRLNKRLGEARYINDDPEEDEGMWVRVRHDRIGKDEAFRSQNTMYELGYDKRQECDNGERRVGMAIDYMHGDTGYDQIAGKGEIDRYGLWLYDTWMGDKGHYADYVAKWGHLSNDFEVYTMNDKTKQVTGDYSNNVFSVSAEYGRKKDIGNDWYFEPQVQAQLARVTGADYTTNQGTKVSVDGINSLIGRAGFRLGKDFGEEKKSTVYIKADVLHEFLGDQDVRVLDKSSDNKWAGISYENEGTWYDVGFGFATQMSKNSYAFMDFEKSFGNDNDETYQINVGMQWSF